MKKTILTIALIATTSLFANSGESLYKKCAGCHGLSGEKVALGKSKIIADMSKEDIINSLKGYQDNSYGGAMKGVMKGQVVSYSPEDIEAVATFIKSK